MYNLNGEVFTLNKTVVIIGGVAGGATAAARLRRLDEFAEIIMLERGSYVSFANCGLPYYVGGVIKQKEKLILVTGATGILEDVNDPSSLISYIDRTHLKQLKDDGVLADGITDAITARLAVIRTSRHLLH